MLPVEIQDKICDMACHALIREREKNSLWNTLLVEMYMYNLVKMRWGLGHIRLKLVEKFDIERKPFSRYGNPLTFYVEVNGHYVDLGGRKGVMFLGNGYEQALSRINFVKSFL